MKQELPGLLFCSELLPDSVQALIEMNAQTREDFFLRYVNCLCVSLSPPAKEKEEVHVNHC